MDFVLRKVELKEALEIVAWEYPAPYTVFNLRGSILAAANLADREYYGVFLQDELVGFFCYGSSAQLTGKKEHELYQDKGYLDIGLGMHPAWCDGGLGVSFVRAGILYARQQGWTGDFRLTVASNNPRAFTVYKRLGFQEVGKIIWHPAFQTSFLVMTLKISQLCPEALLSD